ncbi:MAG: phasin family protein [Steroidobacteraceae bacterium]
MSNRSFDLSTMFDVYRDALAPVLRAQQEGFKTFERLARYQFAVAGDYLDWSLAHAGAAVHTKSFADLVGQQTELNTRLGDKLRTRAEEFSKIASEIASEIATETQGAVTQWFDATTSKVTEAARKAA